MKKFLLVPFTLCLLALLGSCAKADTTQPTAPDRAQSTAKQTSAAERAEAYPYLQEPIGAPSYSWLTDEYLYYIGLFHAEEYENKVAARVRRINLKTGEESSPCPDPLCMHDTLECPCFGAQSMTPLRMFGDWLCIQSTFVGSFKRLVLNTQSSDPYTRRILLNLKTGEWFSAWDSQSGAHTNSYELFSDGDHLYVTAYGSTVTDTATGEVYQPTVIRSVNLKTREEKKVYSHKYYIHIGMVTRQRIYFYESLGDDRYVFYSIDLSGGDLREEPNLSVQPNIVYQNYVVGTSGNGIYRYILINDTQTGEVINTGALSVNQEIDVCGEYLYYLDRGKEYESRWIQGRSYFTAEKLRDPASEEEYQRFNEEMYSYPCYLWRCRLDGSEPEMIVNLGAVNTRYLKIIGNDCYIQDVFYDSETNRWYWGDHQYYEKFYVQRRICKIDLQTGKKETLGTEWVG